MVCWIIDKAAGLLIRNSQVTWGSLKSLLGMFHTNLGVGGWNERILKVETSL